MVEKIISLCMIVKDESQVIRRCLESVSGIVDEIIVVDTGSNDGTKAIVKEYTEQLYEYTWSNNFSAARNYAASKASGEWIIVLDADEYVDRENLKNTINELKRNEEYDIYAVNIINFTGVNGERTAQHKHGRIYKNDNTIKFERAIHEQLIKKEGQASLAISPLYIYHSGYLSSTMKEKKKNTRNTPLIKKELENSEKDAFDYFNLANELKVNQRTNEALKYYVKAYQNRKDTTLNWVPICLNNMLECLIDLKRYDEALEMLIDAEVLYSKVADFLFLRGEIYLLQHRYDDAKTVFLEILAKADNFIEIIKSPDYKDFFPHLRIGQICDLENDPKNAVIHYVEALNINSSSEFAIMKLINLFAKFHTQIEIFEFLRKNQLLKENDNKILLKIIAFASKNGFLELFNKIVEYYFSEDELILKLCELKTYIFNDNLKYKKADLKTTFILSGLNLGIIDIEDLFILYFKDEKLIEKKNILVILSQTKIYPIMQMLLKNKGEIKDLDKNAYLRLIEKCIIYKQLDLIDTLISMKNHFQNIDGKIGDIFYRHDFKNIAIELYEKEDEENMLEQDYINVIEWLIDHENTTEALRFSYNALAKFSRDFRFYKLVYILTLESENYVDSEFLERFIDEFNDSNWIKINILSLT